ncbi:MAG TPA: glycoside hydrolase family 5 protein [Acidimicrobiales bacterium]|nr:glycoside hydrolase family 5 protein [Acidimicrobiales bacterium]
MTTVLVAATLLLSLTGSASALPKVKKAPNTPITGKFRVEGTRIVGPDGRTFVPRGVNKGGLEYFKKGYDETFWNYQRIKSWGANVIRIPLSPAFGLKRMCSFDKDYMKRVDRIVNWGEQLQMLVILDNHTSTRGLTCGAGEWHGPQKAPDVHSLDFAKQLATRYKNRPWVAIDLYNEPHDIPDSIWRNGGVVDGWRSVGMQQLLDAVRSTGNTNLVLATGNLWGNDLRMVVSNPLFNDKNVVYAAHSYPFWCNRVVYYNEPYICNGKPIPPHLDAQIQPAIGKRPVILAEFGTQRSIAAEMQAPIDWAESRKIGWIAWLWGNGKMTDFCLLDEKGNPSVSGKPVKDALTRASGR